MAYISSTLEAEWFFLRAACSADSTPEALAQLRPSVRWQSLFDLADRHGVLPLLYQCLSASAELIPADAMRILRVSYETNLHKAMLLSLELIRIYDRLAERGIEVLAYKGVALAEAIYGDIALRRAGDIDLLVHACDFPRIRDAVGELGYSPHLQMSQPQERAYLKSGYERAFDGSAGPNLLEVQWALQPRFYAVDFDMEGLFRRAVTIAVGGRLMKTLSAEDSFIVLSLHAAKHVWGRLIWLCDLARIMGLPDLDWAAIAAQAKKLRITRILRVGMLLANRIVVAPIPAAADASLPQDAAAEKLAEEVQPLVTTNFNTESFAYFRLMLRLREHKSDRVRFLHRLIFTPGPGEWDTVSLPAALSPLYRLVRLSRLTARALRA